MKSALEIVAYTNATETEGTTALLEVAIAALNRTGFTECAEMADQVLDQFLEESILRLKANSCFPALTKH